MYRIVFLPGFLDDSTDMSIESRIRTLHPFQHISEWSCCLLIYNILRQDTHGLTRLVAYLGALHLQFFRTCRRIWYYVRTVKKVCNIVNLSCTFQGSSIILLWPSDHIKPSYHEQLSNNSLCCYESRLLFRISSFERSCLLRALYLAWNSNQTCL